jgi:TonB-linked SusC/RagA family outer membrane protein
MKFFTLSLALLWSLTVSFELSAQRSLSGAITAVDDGSPLPGATVVVKGTTIGTQTDADGIFRLSNVPTSATAIIISYTGYDSQEVPIGASNIIDVALSTNSSLLGEVVIGAFGIAREKKALGYSSQEVKGDDIVRANEPNVINALQGRVPGAFIQASSGAPGAGSNILLRGISSLNPGADNQPLIVVDGVVISNATNVGSTLPSAGSNAANSEEQFSNSNRLADINPNDIESMNILKGPAATSLYGSRGANGVIVITTKRGNSGRPVVSFNSSYGVDEINKWPAIQTKYREGRFGRLRFNSDGSPLRFQDFGPAFAPGDRIYNNFETFFQQGNRLTNGLSVAGGNEAMRYHLSFSNFQQDGIVPFSNYERTTVRLNTSFSPTKKLTLGGNINYALSGGNKPLSGDKSVLSALSYHSNTFDVNDYINPLTGGQRDYSAGIIDNPRWIAEFVPYRDRVNRYSGLVFAEFKPLPWLDFNYRIGVDQYTDKRKREQPANTDAGSQVRGFVIDQNFAFREINSNFLITLSHKFNDDISGKLILGNSIWDVRNESNSQRGEGLTVAGFYDISNAANLTAGNSFALNRLIGNFAEASIDYKNFLYLSGSFRNDLSSTLPVDNRSFFYPSVAASFVFSEAFKLPENIISFGKLRLSYAEVGKSTVPYQIGTYYGAAGNFPFGTVNSYRQSSLIGSEDLRPERTKGVEAGLEMRFFKSRFGFDLTVFNQRSIDQILQIPVSNTTGFSRLVDNSGEITNEGIELGVDITPVQTKNFSWTINANWSTFSGKVNSVAEGIGEIITYDGFYIVNKLVPGGNVGDLYGFKYRRHESGQLLIDANGFPVTNTTEYVKVGNALPDWLGGLTNTITWKGLRLSGLLEWKHGGDIYDLSLRNSIRNGNIKMTERRHEEVIFKGVTADGQPNTKAVEIEGENFYRSELRFPSASEVLLQDGSWLRVRNVSLSYSLPKSILARLPFTALAVNLTGNNLYLNTPYRGYDPEASQFGAGSNAFGFAGLTTPGIRNYTVGLNVTFK